MTYTPPVAEQRFALDTCAGLGELVDGDLIEAILSGAGAFSAGEWAPLNRVGDTVGAKLTDAGVVLPKGFHDAYQAYVDGGWGTIGGPEEYGGQALPFTLQTVVQEDLGTANMAFGLVTMLSYGAIEALDAHGSDELKRLYLPKLVSGEWTGTMNLTEPQAGSDVGALRTTATPAGDGSWRIKGQKIYITFGDHDLTDNIVHLVLARTPDAPLGTRGISLFLVPKFRLDADGSPGEANDAKAVSIEHKLGIHASPTCTMVYGDDDDCHGWLIGPEHGGMRAMFTMMNNARINVGGQGVQIGERATQAAVDYATNRIQSARAGGNSRDSVAIIDHPDVRRMLLRMKALTEAARALLYQACGAVDRGAAGDADARALADLLTPLIKAYGTDVGEEVASIGIQVHGGMGYVEETGAAQYLRDARIAAIYEGTNGIQAADLVGRKLGLEGGAVFDRHMAACRAEAGDHPALSDLIDACERVADGYRSASVDDRLAGSVPFLEMVATASCGALMARQGRVAAGRVAAGEEAGWLRMKGLTTSFYLDHIVPAATGLERAAAAGSHGFYSLPADAFLAA